VDRVFSPLTVNITGDFLPSRCLQTFNGFPGGLCCRTKDAVPQEKMQYLKNKDAVPQEQCDRKTGEWAEKWPADRQGTKLWIS
jgi:hypothetical protein